MFMKKVSGKSTLKRAVNPMPRNIRSLLEKHGLLELYKARPPYQQNDYIGWITKAKLETTRQKRTQQMLDELKQGNLYMRMKWSRSK
jgi:uncharacterized protein YdeI (YjbR/CyaY-like superfamily)